MLRWTQLALKQLEEINDYISITNSDQIAGRIVERIQQSILQLEKFPISGRAGRVPGTREFVITGTPFLAAYQIEGGTLYILAIYHGAQRWPGTI